MTEYNAICKTFKLMILHRDSNLLNNHLIYNMEWSLLDQDSLFINTLLEIYGNWKQFKNALFYRQIWKIYFSMIHKL